MDSCGVFHRLSCPHTQEQNGSAERKHRHIVETGLTMMARASVPFSYWDDVFTSAVFLINRLPTPILHNISPFEKLFFQAPDYSLLKVYGCACFPHLRPYNTHKLQPRSARCVFIGYSPHHRGYQCLHLASNRLFVARHVLFDENSFPFSETSLSSPPS